MSNTDDSSIDELISTGIADLSDDAAIKKTGIAIDRAGDQKHDDGLIAALDWCDQLQKRSLSEADRSLLEYFRANARGIRQQLKHRDLDAAWGWDQPEFLQQILSLRRAVRSPGYESLPTVRRCQIQTNLGNQLNTLGRFIDALPVWNRALKIKPQFGMALGNRGYGLYRYAKSLYDSGHAYVFASFAHRYYEGEHYDDAKALFSRQKADIEKRVPIEEINRSISMDDHDLGPSKQEREYRKWALYECLFLNPLNDLGPYSIAATDIFHLPSFTLPISDPPTLVGLFNQIKQEFVSARWLLYGGLHSHTVHFSDREVLLYNTLDYPSYALAVEKVKVAYRVAYSLFDKIAFFLNDYAQLGVKPTNVSFRRIWYVDGDMDKRIVRPELVRLSNLPLRGLYWVAKDFVEPDLRDVMEPDAQALYSIRNALEHRYLKVHEMLVPHPTIEGLPDIWTDRLAYSIQREDFQRKTLHLFRLARAAIIYLSLGMHRQEQQRPKGDHTKIAPMPLDPWDDRWKR
jgi:hypothetical protein